MQPELRDDFRKALHQKACAALRANPGRLAAPRRVLSGWLDLRPADPALLRWKALLAMDQPHPGSPTVEAELVERLCDLVCEASPSGRQLRVGSPLKFALPYPEIQAVRRAVGKRVANTP